MKVPAERLRGRVVDRLLAELDSSGHWTGELSSSPLATAVAVFALAAVDSDKHAPLIHEGLRWLGRHVNDDGGWGDCDRAPSNLSTTLLCWSAFSVDSYGREAAAGAERWIVGRVGSVDPQAVASAVLSHYGDDRTFSTPILTMCALAGRLGASPWRLVPQLPLELAAFPPRLYNRVHLPVVSYALPALIALGLVRHHHCPTPGAGVWRNLLKRRVLDVLLSMQPGNGGFLEATPLTAFVTMGLAASGWKDHEVVRRGVRFLVDSRRGDGSWPIDTNLATWLTTFAVNAGIGQALSPGQRETIRNWLLQQQFRDEHPFTHAAPGGWAWTDLPGGVPDADDTAGALLALRRLGPVDERTQRAGEAGVRWLLDLQNRDGGLPTFCRGWGKLPFDRSCPDLTAHALRAWSEWRENVSPDTRSRLDGATRRGLGYLARSQVDDGSWTPLWFGNPWSPGQTNPTYGTAQVVLALRQFRSAAAMVDKAVGWLLSAQNADGGWGGAPGVRSSVEETALAAAALSTTANAEAVNRGQAWLAAHADMPPAPIGLYFASLWYYEKLYPLVFSLAAVPSAT
ncbi:MAG: hypothetical protein AUJ96_03280 [Armatimonadetes bacterium CG2_30_66_41]|nr:squalene--hopene cyclase [Armatimonadota bacterium]OIP10847.1 MAG: hypothetical protein AUJ96_03280 [Armatimonadetes bacterium CG2_30_66_41]PIU90900.1 MAG: squalene--hopene cyclase [Armatimonadetes bacterium CG06_land_8_20_14_3_00_66_21]